MARIRITEAISIDASEIEESFIRASGPGGQHVNRTASAVQLRFNARKSRSLPNDVALRLMRLAGSRLTDAGEIVITARTHRSQQRNRDEALARLVELICRATERPVRRRPTRPPPGSKRRRLEAKKARGAVKRTRGRPIGD